MVFLAAALSRDRHDYDFIQVYTGIDTPCVLMLEDILEQGMFGKSYTRDVNRRAPLNLHSVLSSVAGT